MDADNHPHPHCIDSRAGILFLESGKLAWVHWGIYLREHRVRHLPLTLRPPFQGQEVPREAGQHPHRHGVGGRGARHRIRGLGGVTASRPII